MPKQQQQAFPSLAEAAPKMSLEAQRSRAADAHTGGRGPPPARPSPARGMPPGAGVSVPALQSAAEVALRAGAPAPPGQGAPQAHPSP